jgi:hypothetical protein
MALEYWSVCVQFEYVRVATFCTSLSCVFIHVLHVYNFVSDAITSSKQSRHLVAFSSILAVFLQTHHLGIVYVVFCSFWFPAGVSYVLGDVAPPYVQGIRMREQEFMCTGAHIRECAPRYIPACRALHECIGYHIGIVPKRGALYRDCPQKGCPMFNTRC